MQALEDLESCDLDDVLKELDSLELHFNAELNSLMSSPNPGNPAAPSSPAHSEVSISGGTLKRHKVAPPPPIRRASALSFGDISSIPDSTAILKSDPVYHEPLNSVRGSALRGIPSPIAPNYPLHPTPPRVPVSPLSPTSPTIPISPLSPASPTVPTSPLTPTSPCVAWSGKLSKSPPPRPILPKPKRMLSKSGSGTAAVQQQQSFPSANHSPAHDKARTGSPDSDSAFCDDVSTFSESSVSSNNGVGMTCGVRREDGATVLTIVSESPTQTASTASHESKKRSVLRRGTTSTSTISSVCSSSSDARLLVKVHFEDGSTKCVAVDDEMTCGRAVSLIAEKRMMPLSGDLVLVEREPARCLERVLEDHELLAEQLAAFSSARGQQLWFVRRPLRYDVFVRPERHLLAEACSGDESQPTYQMDESARADLVQDKFEMGGYVPNLEGHLWLKTDGKKSWKRMMFSLKANGLFYMPKGLLGTTKTHCLCNPDQYQIYSGFDWREQLKAPTEFGLALMNESVVVTSTFHLCAETESSWLRWYTALRLARHGSQLLTNFRQLQTTAPNAEQSPRAHVFVERRQENARKQPEFEHLPPPPADMIDDLQTERRRVHFSDETAAPPPEFLSHLRSVIHRKWTVAEKCRSSHQLPHQVLGFQQHEHSCSDKEAQVGRWLRQHYGE